MASSEKSAGEGDLRERLTARLEECGFQYSIVPVDRLKELENDIQRHRSVGSIEEEFDRRCLSGFDFEVATSCPEAASIIMVAAAQPFIRLTFTVDGRRVPVIIPPTYCNLVDGQMAALLEEVLLPSGYKLFRHAVPEKALAVHSGLARYGRNNIAYVEGLGSYCHLRAFYSDMPCGDHEWPGNELMTECENCRTCKKKCPTGAIGEDRFLLHAEHCLTYLNEHEGEFPSKIDPAWHHCLIGCLYCQVFCPVNRKIGIRLEEGPCLTEAETKAALNAESPQPRSAGYERMRLVTRILSDELLARNLRVLLHGDGNIERAMTMLSKDKGNEVFDD